MIRSVHQLCNALYEQPVICDTVTISSSFTGGKSCHPEPSASLHFTLLKDRILLLAYLILCLASETMLNVPLAMAVFE
jgi:hypothetical protein